MSFLYCMLMQITCLVGIDCSARENNSLSLALGLWKYKLPVILIFFFNLKSNSLLFESWKHFFQFPSWYLSLCFVLHVQGPHLILDYWASLHREQREERKERGRRRGGGVDSVCLIYIQLLPKSLRWMVSDKRKTDGKLYTQNRK